MLFSTFKTHIDSTHFTPSFVIILTTNVFHFCIVSLLPPTNASLKAQTPFTLHSTTQYIIKTKEAIIPSIILSSMTGKRSQISPLGRPSSGNISDQSSSKEQDQFLPIANVSRIMKKSLPANVKISKEAKQTIQECVSEFISFITGEASDKCQREKRKTINGDDLLWAMTTLGFENYVGPLKVYLNKYRETEGQKNSMAKLEDHSPANTCTDRGTKADFQGFNNSGFYTIGTQVTPKSFGVNGRITGYEENLVNIGAFNVNNVSKKW